MRTRTDWVEHKLRMAILSGELQPGEKLMSAALERRWNVSQTPVREALQRLGSEGLVELSAQQGARVAAVSTKDMFEIYEARMMLEPVAIRRSVHLADVSFHETLNQAYGGLRDVLVSDGDDLWEFERHHREFHSAMIAACDSRWLLRLVGQLVDHSVRYRLLSWTPRGGSQEILEEHERLFDAARAGDAEGASRLTYEHLRLTLNAVLDVVTPARTVPPSVDSRVAAPPRPPPETRPGTGG